MARSPHIRIETAGFVAVNDRIIFVDEDGSETDISAAVTRYVVHGSIGQARMATVDLIKVEGRFTADVDQVIARIAEVGETAEVPA